MLKFEARVQVQLKYRAGEKKAEQLGQRDHCTAETLIKTIESALNV